MKGIKSVHIAFGSSVVDGSPAVTRGPRKPPVKVAEMAEMVSNTRSSSVEDLLRGKCQSSKLIGGSGLPKMTLRQRWDRKSLCAACWIPMKAALVVTCVVTLAEHKTVR